MCGILALFHPACLLHDVEESRKILDTLSHRGPDDAGVWADREAGILLGHRRLSILDLSPCGHQPMASQDGRWMITFNGEIYNWQELREQLKSEGVSFQSQTDTEVLLEGIAKWGILSTLKKCVGMFVFAVWDRRKKASAMLGIPLKALESEETA